MVLQPKYCGSSHCRLNYALLHVIYQLINNAYFVVVVVVLSGLGKRIQGFLVKIEILQFKDEVMQVLPLIKKSLKVPKFYLLGLILKTKSDLKMKQDLNQCFKNIIDLNQR